MGQNDFCTGKNVRPESALCGKREVCLTSEFSLGGSSLRASPRSVGSRITSGTRSQHSQPLPQPFHVTIMSMRLASQNQPVIGSFNSSFVNGTLHRKACPPPPLPHLTTCCHPHPLWNPHPSSSPFAVPPSTLLGGEKWIRLAIPLALIYMYDETSTVQAALSLQYSSHCSPQGKSGLCPDLGAAGRSRGPPTPHPQADTRRQEEKASYLSPRRASPRWGTRARRMLGMCASTSRSSPLPPAHDGFRAATAPACPRRLARSGDAAPERKV
jgi:hypothetical protein